MTAERSALFVRLSSSVLSDLEQRIELEGRTKQAVVEDLLARQLDRPSDEAPEILDLESAATLLRIDQTQVLDRINDGDFPARRFGNDWRISRSAVLAWLAGTDATTDRPTGFTG